MNKVIFIIGPTASGKSDIAAEFAKVAKGEIISCDSMQVYKHMDIGTAKPPGELMDKVRHHLIDIIEPSEEYSAARFAKEADQIICELHKEKKLPVIVGGR